MKNTSIAAVSTPFGKGGIAVIRISGENAIEIADRMFVLRGGKKLSDCSKNSATYGKIVSEGKIIDDGIATVFRAPGSYTGEDTVEISCHGGVLLTERVLRTAFMCGAVPAGPGEFTERAFMNGKIDLSGAEAVIGLIEAQSEEKLDLCASHAAGVLKKRCEQISQALLELISSVYVSLDYPEEDLEEISGDRFLSELKNIRGMLESTAATYREGKAVAQGVRSVLLGKPNAGKSSILNALLGEERAIVTDVPGTTRDVIEETATCGRILLRLCDTAGIRVAGDAVEKIGIEKALKKAEEAELIIAVFDSSRELDREDDEIFKRIEATVSEGGSCVAVMSKTDLTAAFEAEELSGRLPEGTQIVGFSVTDGEDGVQRLKNACESLYAQGHTDYASVAVLSNARQFSAVMGCKESVERAIFAYENGMGADVCGMDLEKAMSSIGEVDGRSVSDSITSQIFRNFCVGK